MSESVHLSDQQMAEFTAKLTSMRASLRHLVTVAPAAAEPLLALLDQVRAAVAEAAPSTTTPAATRDAYGRLPSIGPRALPYTIRCAGPRCPQVIAERMPGGVRPLVPSSLVGTSGLLLTDCPACRRVTIIDPRGALTDRAEAWLAVDASGATSVIDPAIVRKISEA